MILEIFWALSVGINKITNPTTNNKVLTIFSDEKDSPRTMISTTAFMGIPNKLPSDIKMGYVTPIPMTTKELWKKLKMVVSIKDSHGILDHIIVSIPDK